MTRISFEFFPPRSLDASFRLWETVRTLAPLGPDFVSVTYGAGGTTRDLTHDAVETIRRNWGLEVAAHLTCVGATRRETLAVARRYAKAGLRQIVALRGDAPKGSAGFTAHPDGFADSTALIEALAETGDFHIRVGAYPDPHPEAAFDGADIAWLKRKFEAGAGSAITQFFFEAETFLRFRDACQRAGIDRPVIPGILPIANWDGVRRFAERAGTPVPPWVAQAFANAQRDGTERLLATAIAAELVSDLRDEGVEDFHFYTLNAPELTRDVVRAMGIVPAQALERVA
ncbi:methylenetetrahydrofolate reductase [NAD(P)H] [Mesobaculum littorinae]|uniref:Methylenetetrahydrofolate reductase n=1 Tax=Mesobaculum littorinae TaxID=2486419 RepID=A0A438ALN1_9RHOB|nr:methylenetetrahydrofolate reductase [NAD(P)H] [Mesobaculum littorinae]RVV99579.1 methylenetetrahydrofolate reductase [NAD(P)H] [Mesobaculum littorinae]